MIPYAKQNKGFKYLLTVIDVFSKKLKSRNHFKRAKFKIGDKVRVSRNKEVFDKGYTPNWSTEVLTITRVSPTKPYTYHLKDYYDKPIAGGFYEEELLKTKYSDIYLIEKVLKKSGNTVYVKWLSFDNTHNSWINKNDM
ncbi:uncharacterized protein LOC103316163 [Nasonia vitripennis]|uniref:Chromo domain-containing protein n=1 Tax=Nasonia vitripennis TaxID=7425 RepID=A0A7M7Q2J6_NASVI|nr:uncharacterized protein LOC103316163 [Nasonia vitripennis]